MKVGEPRAASRSPSVSDSTTEVATMSTVSGVLRKMFT